jgi:nitrogen fixation protein NifU and related proteins
MRHSKRLFRMRDSMYSDTVMDHFQNQRNVGEPPDFNATGVAGQPESGPFMVLYLNVRGSVIAGTGFRTFGCGPAIASGSFVTEVIKGKTLEEAAILTPELIIESLGGLPLGKHHCAQLAIAALRDAVAHSPKDPAEEGTARRGESSSNA